MDGDGAGGRRGTVVGVGLRANREGAVGCFGGVAHWGAGIGAHNAVLSAAFSIVRSTARSHAQMATSRIPPIQCLLTFEAVARLRSASRAAAELCVTVSAISHRIRQI